MQLDTLIYKLPEPGIIDPLMEIVMSNSSISFTLVHNLLLAHASNNYVEPIILPERGLKSSKRSKYLGAKPPIALPQLKIFPNPTQDYFILEHHFDDLPEPAEVSIIDEFGREIIHKPIRGKQNQEVIDVRFLKPSVYFILLKSNGLVLAKSKVSVVK